jgi:lipoprotein|nr:hypothetical protein [uncultured Kingella sp.]
MSLKTKMLLLAAAVALAACGENQTGSSTGQTAASVPAPASAASAPAAASEAAPQAASAAVSSKDGKIQISLNGVYQDKTGDAEYAPEGVAAEQIVLLQRDDAADITVSAVSAGKADKDADKLLSELKAAIEGDESVKDVHAAAPENGVLAYRFTHANGEDAANEACITRVSAEKDVATVCAVSRSVSSEELLKELQSGVKFMAD